MKLRITLAAVALLAAGRADAQDKFLVRITVTQLKVIQRPGDDADLYAFLGVDGKDVKTGRKENVRTGRVVEPNWTHAVAVDAAKFDRDGCVKLHLHLKDHDTIDSDDRMDVNPKAKAKILEPLLHVNRSAAVGRNAGELRNEDNRAIGTLRRTGSATWDSDEVTTTGRGDDNAAELKFRVSVVHLPDFEVVAVRDAGGGRTAVEIRNLGGEGTVTRTEVASRGRAVASSARLTIPTGERRTVTLSIPFQPGLTTAFVKGESVRGDPEVNVANNKQTR